VAHALLRAASRLLSTPRAAFSRARAGGFARRNSSAPHPPALYGHVTWIRISRGKAHRDFSEPRRRLTDSRR
jgi:hypothetical protein